MESIKDLHEELKRLNGSIERLLKESKIREYDDLSGLAHNEADPEERLIFTECRSILDDLESVNSKIAYLNKPIIRRGKLQKLNSGRYALESWELSSGSGIEALVPCEYWENGDIKEGTEWTTATIEHNGQDYYLVGFPEVRLDGLTARMRG